MQHFLRFSGAAAANDKEDETTQDYFDILGIDVSDVCDLVLRTKFSNVNKKGFYQPWIVIILL